MKKFLLSLVALFLLSACSSESANVVYTPNYDNYLAWQDSFEEAAASDFEGNIQALVVSSDLENSVEIASAYKSVEGQPSLVVLLGTEGLGVETCSDCIFKAVEGDVTVAGDFAAALLEKGLAQDLPFVEGEKSAIKNQISFVKHYFDEAEVLPLSLIGGNPQYSLDNLSDLADFLAENLPEDALVVVSGELGSDFQNQSLHASLSNSDHQNVLDAATDSRSALFVLSKFLEARGDFKIEEVEAGFVLTNEESEGLARATVMALGNMPRDNTLRFSDSGIYFDEFEESFSLGTERFLEEMPGGFFRGVDFIVFDLVENSCRIDEQNNLRLLFCRFDEEEVDLEVMKNDGENADFIFTMIDFERGEIDASRRALAVSIAEAGADVILGRGLEEVLPLRTYKNSIVMYSLGNFVDDSKLLTELSENTEGIVAGITVSEEALELQAWPLVVENGHPKLMSAGERTAALFRFFQDVKDLGHDLDTELGKVSILRYTADPDL